MAGPNGIDIYIGGRIRKIREFRGIARDAVAAALDISSTEVGILERGLKRLTPEQMLIIADTLNVRPSFLFGNLSLRFDREEAGALTPFFEGMVRNLLELHPQ